MFRDAHASPMAQSFHPELGYLCPAAGLRRRARRLAKLALVAVVVAGGSALGLSSALVAPPAEEAAGVKLEAAVLVPPSWEPMAGEQAAPERAMPAALAAELPRTAVPQGEAALAHARACNDLSASFLSLQCRSGRKARAATAATHRVASVPLGRVDAAAEVEGGKPARGPLDAATAAHAEVAPADKPAKKPVKAAQKPMPIHDNAETPVAAPAPAPLLRLFGLFRDLTHLPNPFATSVR
jgi:hypothetical protein